jgi:hypothetical protein
MFNPFGFGTGDHLLVFEELLEEGETGGESQVELVLK